MKFNKLENGQRSVPQKSFLNLILKMCRQPGFKKLIKNPHGVLVADHQENSFLAKRIYTVDKKVNLAPDSFLKAAIELNDLFEKKKSKSNFFKLIIKRTVRTHNSWTHNTERMIRGTENTNFAYLNSNDAKNLKLKNGDLVDVSNNFGSIRLPVKLSNEILSGAVAIPHGWGHQHAKGLSVANKTKGVNVNILAGSGINEIDPLSGMSKLTAIEVKIEKSKARRAETWSGIDN